MELELKHLAGYLPYGLGIYSETYGIKSIMTIRGNGGDNPSDSIESVLSGKFKPLLRPLSSLMKEIEVDGEPFVPMLELIKIAIDQYDRGEGIIDSSEIIGALYGINRISVLLSYDVKCSLIYDSIQMKFIFNSPQNLMFACGYILFEKLYEWHFDIYGLIDKGLAIAIKD